MLEGLIYFLSGFAMKISDDAHDKKNNIMLGFASAIICGASLGFLASFYADAACIFLGIVIGTLIAWKVDCLNHALSLVIFLFIIIWLGLPHIGIISMLLCASAAFLDEIGNDSSKLECFSILRTFFQYRFSLKIVVLILALLSYTSIVIPVEGLQFFTIQTFLFFILFELSYELAGLKFDTIYDGLHSLRHIRGRINRSADD